MRPSDEIAEDAEAVASNVWDGIRETTRLCHDSGEQTRVQIELADGRTFRAPVLDMGIHSYGDIRDLSRPYGLVAYVKVVLGPSAKVAHGFDSYVGRVVYRQDRGDVAVPHFRTPTDARGPGCDHGRVERVSYVNPGDPLAVYDGPKRGELVHVAGPCINRDAWGPHRVKRVEHVGTGLAGSANGVELQVEPLTEMPDGYSGGRWTVPSTSARPIPESVAHGKGSLTAGGGRGD